jgi:hypothetical protein
MPFNAIDSWRFIFLKSQVMFVCLSVCFSLMIDIFLFEKEKENLLLPFICLPSASDAKHIDD